METSFNHHQNTINCGHREYRIDGDGELYEGRTFIEDDRLAAAKSIKEPGEPASSRLSASDIEKVLKPMSRKTSCKKFLAERRFLPNCQCLI